MLSFSLTSHCLLYCTVAMIFPDYTACQESSACCSFLGSHKHLLWAMLLLSTVVLRVTWSKKDWLFFVSLFHFLWPTRVQCDRRERLNKGRRTVTMPFRVITGQHRSVMMYVSNSYYSHSKDKDAITLQPPPNMVSGLTFVHKALGWLAPKSMHSICKGV